MRGAGPGHARTIEVPSTLMFLSGSGDVAGPRTTDPSATAKRLPWHGQSIVPSVTSETVQPWCVQIAENALNSPAVGWVTTTCWSAKTAPPPTGTSAVLVSTADGVPAGSPPGAPA